MLGTSHLRQDLLSRVRAAVPHHDYFAKAINAALDVADKLDEEIERIDRDGRFTAKGRADYLANVVRETLAPKLAKEAGKVARHAGERNESRLVAVGRPDFDKADAVGELQRQEVRSYLRQQPAEKRVQTALELALDRGMGEAIFFGAGRTLTGLNDQQFDQARRAFLQHHHSDELGEIEKMRDDVEAVAAAVQVAWTKLKEASGMHEVEFKSFWQTLEKVADKS